jgi:hypothetical protein
MRAIYKPQLTDLKLRSRARPINQPDLIPTTTAALVQVLRRVVLINTSRRHPKRRILLKEIARAQHNAQRLRRHNREVFGAREMRNTKLQPADDVFVLDVIVTLAPIDDGLIIGPARLAGRLADVVAGGEELVFAVFGHPQRVAGKTRAAPDETAGSA